MVIDFKTSLSFNIIAALCFAATFYATPAAAAATPIVFGLLNVPTIETPDYLIGIEAAFFNANRRNLAPGHTFVLERYVYPHCDYTNPFAPQCDTSAAMVASGSADFLGNMSRFHAVLNPSYVVAPAIVAKAATLGIPVIDPVSITAEHYEMENVFFLVQRMETELSVLMKYMFTAHSCAHTGLFYEVGLPSVDGYRAYVRNAFAMGGYPAPVELGVSATTTPAEIASFYFGDDDSSRACILMLTTGSTALNFVNVITPDPRFEVGKRKLFVWSYVALSMGSALTDAIVEGAYRMAFLDVYFPFHLPSLWNAPPGVLGTFNKAIGDVVEYGPVREHNTTINTFTLQSFITAMWGLEIYGKVAPRFDLSNVTEAWGLFVTAAYEGGDVRIGADFPLPSPIRSCLPRPMFTTCQCNVINRFSYMYAFDLALYEMSAIQENAHEGQVGATSAYFDPTHCTINVTSDTFPVPMLLMTTPDTTDAPITNGGLSQRDLYFSFVRNHNQKLLDSSAAFASNSRRRVVALEYPLDVASGSIPARDVYLEALSKTYEPFAMLGSDAEVSNPRVLMFGSGGAAFPLEDPPLTIRPTWNERSLLLAPAFADYAHAAASYYAAQQQRGAFTQLLLAATSRDAATLLVRSLHTFQVRASVSDVFVSADVGAVGAHLAAAAAGSSSMPFILVGVHDGNAAAVVGPLAAAVQSGAVRAASRVVCTVVASDRSLDTFSALPALPLTLDVLFPSVYSEWWVEGSAIWQTMAALGAPMDVVGGHAAYLAPTLAYSLGDQLAANRVGGKGAAEVLYTARTASFADVPLGPFSNDTCSDAVVKSNAVDRACQCSKGFRLFRVHSVADWRARRPSTGYVYQMTTCGVLYLPLLESGAVDSTMTKVAIGVGVGGGLLLLILGGALLLFAVFGGRNNRNAPTDATKAFSMAFTDIQASTMLWARTPALMSDAVEHHCSIVRALIAQHKGYEVKTIGDSFMVAFVEAEDAARFGELQEAMFNDEWWPAELDQHYRRSSRRTTRTRWRTKGPRWASAAATRCPCSPRPSPSPL